MKHALLRCHCEALPKQSQPCHSEPFACPSEAKPKNLLEMLRSETGSNEKMHKGYFVTRGNKVSVRTLIRKEIL